jgi:hypothetical protein
MEKSAQKRSILNQLREKVNMPGAYLEGFFKPELDRVMTSLKDLDDRIRSVLTGKKIGNAEAPEDGVGVKDLLKSARTNFNRREYMAGVVDLGQFHKKMFDVTRDIDKFFVDVNKIHHKFLFEGLKDTGYDENLKKFREHMDTVGKKASAESEYFIKEAGIMDFFYNIGTKRGRSLAAWEKKYPKQTKDLREGGDRLITEAQKLLENTISYLKQMGTARATRRPDEYMDVAHKIKAEYEKFDNGDKGFKSYYNNAIMPWLKIKDEIEAKEVKNTPPPETSIGGPTTGKVELGNDPVQTSPVVAPTVIPSTKLVPELNFRTQPQVTTPVMPPTQLVPETDIEGPISDDAAPDTERNPNLPAPLVTKAPILSHQHFYESLESLSKEDPRILSKYISKYASSIQESDPEVAINLFLLVKRIKK